MWAKSQDSVQKPPFLKRKESQSGSNRDPSAYQPSALPLGHTGSQEERNQALVFSLFLNFAVTTAAAMPQIGAAGATKKKIEHLEI